jgi:hypothetical protein
MKDVWNPLPIADAATRFGPHGIAWWVAGGHAIDLFLGWESRAHDDLDLEMFRGDANSLGEVFDGWDLVAVSDDGSEAWRPDAALAADVYAVWVRPSSDAPWAVEIMFADGGLSVWKYRRDNSITMDGHRLVRMSPDGVPYGAPEVQLLYKSSQRRPKDDADLVRTLHLMTQDQKEWLLGALAKIQTTHPWIPVLQNSIKGHHE